MDEIGEQEHRDSGSPGNVIGLILLVVLALWGYNRWKDNTYSKPWWDGTKFQQVCDWQGVNCYELPVTINKENQFVSILFPNGGNAHGYVGCYKRYGGGRFCDFSDQAGNQWDIFPLNQ